MTSIAVYVTSRYKNYPEFKVTLDSALKKYLPVGKPNALCTGSSKNTSAGNGLVKRYAFENGIPCRVFETEWSKHIPTEPGKKNTAGVRANAMIIRNSNAAVMFYTPTSIAKWDFMSGGCYNFRKMCGKLGRELIPIKVDIYKPVENDVEDEPITTTPTRDDAAVQDVDMPMAPTGGMSMPHGSSATPMPPPMPNTGMSSSPPPAPMPTGDGDSMQTATEGPAVGPYGITDMSIDVNGDGTPDEVVPTMDVNGDGTPDAQLVPVDSDNNGVIDDVTLAPLPTTTPPQQNLTAPQPPIPTATTAPAAANGGNNSDTEENQTA